MVNKNKNGERQRIPFFKYCLKHVEYGTSIRTLQNPEKILWLLAKYTV